jgi:stage III sporulation protein AG
MLDEWIRKGSGEKKDVKEYLQGKKFRYLLIIIACLGLLALIWPISSTEESPAPVARQDLEEEGSMETKISRELESILSQIEGAGRVRVSISLSSDGLKSYATNMRNEKRESEEIDPQKNNKKSNEESVVRELAVSSGSPLLIENKSPEVLGVLVVADGARSAVVREKLNHATATLLNIAAHKVVVVPGKEESNGN